MKEHLMLVPVLVALFVLVVLVFGAVVPPTAVRVASVVFSVALLTWFGHNNVPRPVWIGAHVVCVAVLVLAGLRAPRSVRPVPAGFWWVVGVWAVLGVNAVVFGTYSLTRAALYFGCASLLAWIAARIDAREMVLVLRGLLLVISSEAVHAVVTATTGAGVTWGYRNGIVRDNPLLNDVVARSQGAMGHPIVFGMFMGVGVLIAWSNRAQLGPVVRTAALAVTAGGVLLSGTRSVALFVVIGIVVHLLSTTRVAVWLRNVLLAGVLGGIVFILNFGISHIVEELFESGSWVHRMESILAVPALLARTGTPWWFGSGFGSEEELFDKGFIVLSFGLKVVDNWYVYLLGTTGVVGLAAFVGALVVVALRSDALGRALTIFVAGMGFSFDLYVWTFVGILVSLLFALPWRASLAAPSERGAVGAHRAA